jgi:SAM-dependent methyltransferase
MCDARGGAPTARPRALTAVIEPGELVVNREISPRDGMFAGNPEHYASVGRSALRCVGLALLAAGRPDPRRILDLPCGHGRVLRVLRAAWPDAEITACDLDHDGVDYCERVFGAMAVPSVADPDAIPLESGSFDLVWCGSLLTHVAAARWDGFLRLFARVLAPGGVLVFTTHGRFPAQRIRGAIASGLGAPNAFYGLPSRAAAEVLRAYERDGFGYVNYPGERGYGISLSTLPWVVARIQHQPGLRVVACSERAWDDHQDVYACALDGG